jgi:hypothetical protein
VHGLAAPPVLATPEEAPELTDERQMLRRLIRLVLLAFGAIWFLLALSSTASALDVQDADQSSLTDTVDDTVGTATDAVSDTAGTATDTAGTATDTAGTATDTVRDTTGTATDTAGTATDTVSDNAGTATDTAGTATDTVSDTAGTATDTAETASGTISGIADSAAGAATTSLGRVTGVVDDGLGSTTTTLGRVTGVVDDTRGGVTGLVDDGLGGITRVVDDALGGAGGLLSTIDVPSVPGLAEGNDVVAAPTNDGLSAVRHDAVRPSLTMAINDVHLATTGVSNAGAGGAQPGPAPAGGIPFGPDAAAAASSSFNEAGGTGLVWAILALLVLLPALDDRWLRFVRAALPRTPYVALDGRPG